MRALAVWWEGAVVGSLTVDRHGAMRFAYDGGWVADPSAAALSVSLPKRLEPFPPRACRPFFEGLLPEGTQRDAVAAVRRAYAGHADDLRVEISDLMGAQGWPPA